MSESLIVASRIKTHVKHYMAATGIKQCYLAKEIGYDPKRFSQLINGRVPMGIDDLARICKYFRISADVFIPIDCSSVPDSQSKKTA